MGFSPLNYVDDKFFQDVFDEVSEATPGTNTYPVKIVSLRIGWILREPVGRKFLDEVLSSENLDFYKHKTLKMLIKFLYNRFKNELLFYLLPLYITQLIMYESSMYTLEYYIHELWDNKNELVDGNLALDETGIKLRKALMVIVTINFILVLFSIFFLLVTF